MRCELSTRRRDESVYKKAKADGINVVGGRPLYIQVGSYGRSDSE